MQNSISAPTATCHWTRMAGPLVDGHATSSAVWICEYPYPTMLLAPPDDCEDCPIYKLRQASMLQMTA